VKVLYLTFLTNPNRLVINYKNVHEGDIFMSLLLIILAIFSIFFGYITKDIFIGLGFAFFSDNSLFIHPIIVGLNVATKGAPPFSRGKRVGPRKRDGLFRRFSPSIYIRK
jgi:NADH:ubiquinone oxidoreductase subunit 5 (subunit L)/multisubunit Na+/H+ antiporter MnhA subunit